MYNMYVYYIYIIILYHIYVYMYIYIYAIIKVCSKQNASYEYLPTSPAQRQDRAILQRSALGATVAA